MDHLEVISDWDDDQLTPHPTPTFLNQENMPLRLASLIPAKRDQQVNHNSALHELPLALWL